MNHQAVFEKLKTILKPFESRLSIKTDDDATYYLDYKLTDTNAKPEMFAAIMIKKNYVSMYYMPVYHDPNLLADISPELKKHMQGKSCFNFTNADDQSVIELEQLINRTAKV